MPLLHKKSKAAFEHNIKAEMKAGKPTPQALAIAYSVKRKGPKKMAEGGTISAKTEKRPMPNDLHDDAKQERENSGKKPAKMDSWTDRPDMKQTKPKMTPMKAPRIASTGVFKTHPLDILGNRLHNDEDHLEQTKAPSTPKEQPSKWMDEKGAKRQGPESRDLHMKKMANGGKVDPDHSGNKHNKAVDDEYGDGAEEDMQQEPAGLMEDNDQIRPSEEEYMANHFDEGGNVISYDDKPDKGYGKIIFKAEGGEISSDDAEVQPEDEAKEEHHASICAAIMALEKRKAELESDSDDDQMVRMAEGGEVDLEESNRNELPNAYYHENEHTALKEPPYGEDMEDDQPEDSNEIGDEREKNSENEDDDAIIRRIRSRKSA